MSEEAIANAKAPNIAAPKTCLYVTIGQIRLIPHHATKDNDAKKTMLASNRVKNNIRTFILYYYVVND